MPPNPEFRALQNYIGTAPTKAIKLRPPRRVQLRNDFRLRCEVWQTRKVHKVILVSRSNYVRELLTKNLALREIVLDNDEPNTIKYIIASFYDLKYELFVQRYLKNICPFSHSGEVNSIKFFIALYHTARNYQVTQLSNDLKDFFELQVCANTIGGLRQVMTLGLVHLARSIYVSHKDGATDLRKWVAGMMIRRIDNIKEMAMDELHVLVSEVPEPACDLIEALPGH